MPVGKHVYMCKYVCWCVCGCVCVCVCIIVFLCAVWREAEDRTGAVAEQDSNGEGGRWLGATGGVCPQQ